VVDIRLLEVWRTAMIRSVVSIRRGIDLLMARGGIDARRLGFVGHSYGALIGVDAVAVDRRFGAAVFEVGPTASKA
jgi:dipeptidyl aminopeptidase/acylaminoacyl peptidase